MQKKLTKASRILFVVMVFGVFFGGGQIKHSIAQYNMSSEEFYVYAYHHFLQTIVNPQETNIVRKWEGDGSVSVFLGYDDPYQNIYAEQHEDMLGVVSTIKQETGLTVRMAKEFSDADVVMLLKSAPFVFKNGQPDVEIVRLLDTIGLGVKGVNELIEKADFKFLRILLFDPENRLLKSIIFVDASDDDVDINVLRGLVSGFGYGGSYSVKSNPIASFFNNFDTLTEVDRLSLRFLYSQMLSAGDSPKEVVRASEQFLAEALK